MKLKDYFGLFCRLAVGGILFYAGFIKAAGQPAEFAAAIAAYKILPASLVTPLAMGLPYIEMWVGLFVLAGFYTSRASWAAAALFTLFLVVLGSAVARGIDLTTCGCFGSDSLSPRYSILLDIGLLALSLASQKINKYAPAYSLDRTLA